MNIISRTKNYITKEVGIYKALHNDTIQYRYLLLSRLHINPNKFDSCDIHGMRFHIRSNTTDYKIMDEVVLHDCYRIHKVKRSKTPIETIIDLGAFIGDFTILASHTFPNAKIYAVEPEKSNYHLLKQNIHLNHEKNVKLYKKAIDAKKRILFLQLHKNNHGNNGLNGVDKPKMKQRVTGMSFSELWEKNAIQQCDLLKIDIEGGEYEFFSLKRHEPYLKHTKLITMEYHVNKAYPMKYYAKLLKRLEALQFAFDVIPTNNEVGMIYAWNKSMITKRPF